MFSVRTTVIGGIVFLAVQASGVTYPRIPRKVFNLIRVQSVLARIKPQFVNPPANIDTVQAVANSSTSATAGVLQVAQPPSTPKVKPPWLVWLDDNIFDRVDVSGSRVLGVHAYSVTGDVNAYDETTNFGEGGQTFTSDGELTVTGRKVLGVASFTATIQDNRLSDPNTQQILIEYDKGPLKLSEGDIRGSLLTTNPLTSFAKSLHGSMAEYQKGPFHVKALYSETKGSPRTVSIQGSNSSGPYYLESGKLESDTLEVEVDGLIQKPGVDFVADAQIGSITFLSRVIPATSTIVATFEAVAPGTAPGILAGIGASYDFGAYGRFGINYMKETATGDSGDGTVPDLFVFAGASSTTYLLSYEPIPSTVVVQLGDKILTQGTYVNGQVLGDYALNPIENRQLILNSALAAPENTTLYVKYRPLVVQSVVGDREVFGLDYTMRLGKMGMIQYAQAMGRTINTSTPSGGLARTLTANYTFDKIKFTGTVKDIPSDYVAIESQGFNRNEESYSLGAETKVSKITYGVTYYNGVISNETTTATTTELQNARSTTAKAYANYNSADGTTWTASQTRTSGHLTYDSQLDDSSLTAIRVFGKLKLDTGFEYQQGYGPLLNSAGTTQIGNVYMNTYHVTLGYVPKPSLSFESRASVSQVRALGTTSLGNDISLSSNWKPNSRWTVTGSTLRSVSGQSAVLSGFSTSSSLATVGTASLPVRSAPVFWARLTALSIRRL